MSQVSDYNIANASGASVRSDLNAVFDAIKTLNSGGTDPANPEAFMPYVDTADSNNLKIRNAANNGFTTVGSINEANLGLLLRSGGTMTGPILGDDGSGSGSPAYAFDNDTDTGMFRVGANILGFATSGSKKLHIDSAGLTIMASSSDSRTLSFQEATSNGNSTVSIKSPSSLSGSVTFSLPGADGTNGQMLQTNGSGALSFTTVAGVPIGSVFCIAHTSVPSGYLECNGDALPNGTGTVQGITANFAPLRALIGSSLPDLRGEFIRGFDNGKGTDNGRSMLSSQGDQNAYHRHSGSVSGTTSTKSLTGNVRKISETFAGNGTTSGVFSKLSNQDASLTPGGPDTSPTGGFSMDASHNHTFSDSFNTSYHPTSSSAESRPRNIAMMYIIKF